MSEFIPLSVPHISGREMEYVKSCLETGWVSSAGPFVDRFEKEFAKFIGSKYAIACSSGTAALHVSLLLAGVEPDTEVLVPTITFIASVNAIRYCNAHPVFFDCDEFYNLDANQVIAFLKDNCEKRSGKVFNKKSGRRISAILPVHVFGNAANLEKLLTFSEELNIPLVEDAAESLGTRYAGTCGDRHTGTLGKFGAFSFNGNKIITTGGGGMIATDDESLALKAKYLTTQAKDDEVRFVHDEIGFNYRMTNVQAAIGVAQLELLPSYLKKKEKIYTDYLKNLEGVAGIKIATPPSYAKNNLWMLALQISPKYRDDREGLMARLQKANIQTRPVWVPNHLQKPFLHHQKLDVSQSEALWKKTLNIPCSIGLTNQQLEKVCQELKA